MMHIKFDGKEIWNYVYSESREVWKYVEELGRFTTIFCTSGQNCYVHILRKITLFFGQTYSHDLGKVGDDWFYAFERQYREYVIRVTESSLAIIKGFKRAKLIYTNDWAWLLKKYSFDAITI